MEEYKISSSLEWTQVKDKLLKSKRNLTMFSSDIHRLMCAIDDEVKVLGNLEVTARNQKTSSSNKRVQEQIDIVNKRIKNFNKLYMMALLTHD
jgi:hypothetical protein